MIWVLSNEAEENGVFTTYDDYKKAYDDGFMGIYCAKQNETFDFINKDDIVIVRTRDKNINECLRKAQSLTGFKSTLESEITHYLTYDKLGVKPFLQKAGVTFPQFTTSIDELKNDCVYFVKPCAGEDSRGVDEKSKCKSVDEVIAKCKEFKKKGKTPLIEEFIDGDEVATTILYSPEDNDVKTFSAKVNPNKHGFYTYDVKAEYDFTTTPYHDKKLEEDCKKVFEIIGAKHYLRIDSRVRDGKHYIIDINMIPSLNRKSCTAKCFEANNVEYYDFIRMVVNSAN